MRKPTIYLAGAIRDDHKEDVQWRERAIAMFKTYATILNPLGGKSKDKDGNWTMSGIRSTAKTIVKQDFWCVDRADILVANLIPLASGYPSIGTLTEYGRATGTGALIFVSVEAKYTGHENASMYKLHPFIEENATVVFTDVDEMLRFVSIHLRMLSGFDPSYKGENSKFIGGLNPLYDGSKTPHAKL